MFRHQFLGRQPSNVDDIKHVIPVNFYSHCIRHATVRTVTFRFLTVVRILQHALVGVQHENRSGEHNISRDGLYAYG